MSVLTPEALFEELSNAVVEMDEERVITGSEAALAADIDAYDAIQQGLSHGMERAGQLFEDEEYFIPELLM